MFIISLFKMFIVLTLLCRLYHCFYLTVRPCLPEKSKYTKALKSLISKIQYFERCKFTVVSSLN